MSESSRDAARPLSWRKKLLFALMTTLGFFVLLEAALALIGFKPVTDSSDPFVGFSEQIPLLERGPDNGDGATVRTAAGKLPWFNPQSFPIEKPANTRRVFCVGGSTTFGRPFTDLTSYCGHLRELLPVADPAVNWEVINAGGVSYASYRVAAVMEELARYEPDLFIVYSAHNEFLERRTYAEMFAQAKWSREAKARLSRSRVWSLVETSISGLNAEQSPEAEQLPGEVDEMLNHSIGPRDYRRDDDWHEKVLRHYEFNLVRMVEIAREAGAEIVFIAPASNLRDCKPFKSEVSTVLSDDAAAEAGFQLDVAITYLEEGRFQAALEVADAVVTADRRLAEAHFLRGRALLGLQDNERAKLALQQALEEDVCPLRATAGISDIIRRVSQQQNVPVVEFRNLLEQRCQQQLGHTCLGNEHFLDHVHPTIEVHCDLAMWIIDELQSQSLIAGQRPTEEEVAKVRQRIEVQIDTDAQGIAFRNLAKVMHWAGRFRDASRHARDALRLLPEDLESQFVLADCLQHLGRDEEAIEAYWRLFEVGDFPRAHLPFGLLLADHGQFESAQVFLLQALVTARDEDQAVAHFALGRVYLQLGDLEPALELLEESNRLYPDDPSTLASIAEAKLRMQDQAGAAESLRHAILIEGEDSYLRVRLGLVLLKLGELDAAREQIARALELEPDNRDAIEALKRIEAAVSRGS